MALAAWGSTTEEEALDADRAVEAQLQKSLDADRAVEEENTRRAQRRSTAPEAVITISSPPAQAAINTPKQAKARLPKPIDRRWSAPSAIQPATKIVSVSPKVEIMDSRIGNSPRKRERKKGLRCRMGQMEGIGDAGGP